MADLTEQQASESVKITGSDSTGVETNYVGADSNGNLQVLPYSNGPVTPGTAAAKADLAAGQFNSTLPSPTTGQQVALQVDYAGRLLTSNTPLDGAKSTYSAAILGHSAANTPTDIFTISGSATKTIRVVRIALSGTQTTSAIRDIQLLKRSSADSGGTSTALTAVPHDSNNAAATASVLAYTANPTSLGTLVGAVRADKMDLSATNLVGSSDRIAWEFGYGPHQALVLRGTSQILAINLNSVTSSNDSLDIGITWTEE